ncbi:hypothetical protein GCM10020219_025090 [Nonomuraea dietziae]
MAEAIVLMEAAGVDAAAGLDVLAGGLAASRILDLKRESMLARSFQPGFRIDLHHKDMGIILDAARTAEVALPMSRAHRAARRRRPRPGARLARPLRAPAGGRGALRQRKGQPMKMPAMNAVVEVLRSEGVDVAFGCPGAAILPLYKAMEELGGIEHLVVRHEEGATHMADGWARTNGRVGLAIGTSGPAGTNMITGLYTAFADSIPIVCVTGQAASTKLHQEAFQAVDIVEIAKPVTKWAVQVKEAAQAPWIFREAFRTARSGRPRSRPHRHPRRHRQAGHRVRPLDRRPAARGQGRAAPAARRARARPAPGRRAPAAAVGRRGRHRRRLGRAGSSWPNSCTSPCRSRSWARAPSTRTTRCSPA